MTGHVFKKNWSSEQLRVQLRVRLLVIAAVAEEKKELLQFVGHHCFMALMCIETHNTE